MSALPTEEQQYTSYKASAIHNCNVTLFLFNCHPSKLPNDLRKVIYKATESTCNLHVQQSPKFLNQKPNRIPTSMQKRKTNNLLGPGPKSFTQT